MKATADDYRKRSMVELEIACLVVLNTWQRPLRCGRIGEGMFPEAIHRGSAPFARIAGKVVKRLRQRGWVTSRADGYEITHEGKRALRRCIEVETKKGVTE